MEGALAWLTHLIEWVGRFVPRWRVVPPYEAGVKYVGGKHIKPFGSGIVVWWPARTEVRIYPVARQSVNLPTQTLLTKDDRTVAVGGVVIYRVVDVVALMNTWEEDATIRDIAAGALHDICSGLTYEELKDQATLKQALKREMRKRLRPFGVKVLNANLTDRAPAKVVKLIQTVSQDGDTLSPKTLNI